MRSLFALIVVLFATLSCALAQDREPLVGPEAGPVQAQRAEKRMRQQEMAERFRHREARIREAVARGDLTEAEADMLRNRLEQRREKLDKLRQQRRARFEAMRERREQAKAARKAEAGETLREVP